MFKKLNKEEKILESEDPVKLQIKPTTHNFQKLSDVGGEDDTKNSRLKAFQIMKMKNNVKDLNKNLYNNDKPENRKKEIHQNIYVNDEEEEFSNKNNLRNYDEKSKNLFVLDKFEQFYNDKLENLKNSSENINQNEEILFENNPNQMKKKFNLELKYLMGSNAKSKGSMCFHKEFKWVAYLNRNLVIIENFEKEENREQKILKDSKSYLNTVKISENGNYLYAFRNKYEVKDKGVVFPEIYFWECKKDFVLLNKTVFNHKELLDAEISHKNNFCAVISSNSENESFVSILDFFHNEVLVTTVMTFKMFSLKWNRFLASDEFSTLSQDLYTFWRLNSNATLQYQYGDFDEKLLQNKQFVSIEFTPPLSCNCTVLLLIGLNNGEIWGVDTKTNSVAIKFNAKDSFVGKPVSLIHTTIRYVTVVSENVVKYYLFPSLRNIKYDDLNIFVNKEDLLEFDSDIVSFDFDVMKSLVKEFCLNQGLVLTEKGVLWYLNYQEKANVRINVTLAEDEEILTVKLINKDFQKYALRKIDFDNLRLEEVGSEYKQNEYFLITGHKNGKIRLWSIPEYSLLLTFDVVTEELAGIETCPNDLKLIAFYKTGTLRFFDLEKGKCLGKYKAISNETYAFARFLPDGKHVFLLDNYGTFFLLKLEKWEPIAIQLHQLFNLSGEILQFSLNPLEQYNKFLINLSNVYLCVYNRKYTNLLKNLEYDSSVPQFSLMDKFNVEEYFKYELKLDKADIVENFVMEFSPKDKCLVYILSQARKVMLVRHFEHHQNVKHISFDSVHPVDFLFATDSSFIIYVLKQNKLQISHLNSEKGTVIQNILSENSADNDKILVSVSPNSRMVVIANKNSVASYSIKLD